MSILIPREDKFYRLFEQAAANVWRGAQMLNDLLTNFTDVATKVKLIQAAEHEGDTLTHEIFEQLNRSFVTPLDREDIAAIAHALDDVLDYIEASADAFQLYDIDEPTSAAIELGTLISQAAEQVHKAILAMRHRKQAAQIREAVVEINRIENLADQVYRGAMSSLFRQADPVRMIKWKQVYDYLEQATDLCEDVGDVLQGVLLKNA
jgi:predicted phosphate transport protein (TIGR00153 family)